MKKKKIVEILDEQIELLAEENRRIAGRAKPGKIGEATSGNLIHVQSARLELLGYNALIITKLIEAGANVNNWQFDDEKGDSI